MKRAIIILTGLFMTACANDDALVESQSQSIRTYLTRTYGEEFDGYVTDGVFRHIGGNVLPESERAVLKKNDRVSIWFEEFMFSTAPTTVPFFTNIEEIAEQLPFDTSRWSLEALQFNIGSKTILTAVENALIGCHRGDSIEVYITSNHGYGDHAFGNVPKNTPLLFRIEIE